MFNIPTARRLSSNVAKQANKQTSKQANKQTSKQANNNRLATHQTNVAKQANKQTSKQASKQTSKQANKQTKQTITGSPPTKPGWTPFRIMRIEREKERKRNTTEAAFEAAAEVGGTSSLDRIYLLLSSAWYLATLSPSCFRQPLFPYDCCPPLPLNSLGRHHP